MSHDLECRELVEMVTDLFEGALGEVERRRCEEHLAICPGCRTYVEQMRLTIEVLAKGLGEEVTSDDRAILLQLFRERLPQPEA